MQDDLGWDERELLLCVEQLLKLIILARLHTYTIKITTFYDNKTKMVL